MRVAPAGNVSHDDYSSTTIYRTTYILPRWQANMKAWKLFDRSRLLLGILVVYVPGIDYSKFDQPNIYLDISLFFILARMICDKNEVVDACFVHRQVA